MTMRAERIVPNMITWAIATERLSASRPRHRPPRSHRRQHAGDDRRRTLHYDSDSGGQNEWAAGDSRLGARRHRRALRWNGLGRVGRGHAGHRRSVSLPLGGLRTRAIGTADELPVYLA